MQEARLEEFLWWLVVKMATGVVVQLAVRAEDDLRRGRSVVVRGGAVSLEGGDGEGSW